VIEVNAGVVPLGGMANQLVADNIMLVGDAARQVNPLTGAGVRFAVRAGKMAGEIAARSVEVGDYSKAYLRQYEMRCKQEFGRRFKAFKALRNILFELSDADYEVIFEELSRLTLRKTQIDQIDPWSFLPRAVGSIIVKRPTIAFKLRKILPSLVNK
jgi:digeranylgeranylglycerophospholipid reductase